MIATLLSALVVAAPTQTATFSPRDSSQVMGGVLAPAKLPAGTIALYGLVGAPELGAGYRQGFEALELEARALFNVFQLSAAVEGGVRLGVYQRDRLQLAPSASLGLVFNSGSTYFDAANFGAVSFRPRLGGTASYAINDLFSGLLYAELPWAIGLSAGGHQVTPVLGAGAEVYLGGSLSLLVAAHVGVDIVQAPGVEAFTRPAWGLRFGLGHRVF
jgi:hypothetical protein